MRWEDIASNCFYFLNKIRMIVINCILQAGMGVLCIRWERFVEQKTKTVTLGNENLNWEGGTSWYLLYTRWNSSDWWCDIFPPWLLWPNIVIYLFFSDAKVNDLSLDLSHTTRTTFWNDVNFNDVISMILLKMQTFMNIYDIYSLNL